MSSQNDSPVRRTNRTMAKTSASQRSPRCAATAGISSKRPAQLDQVRELLAQDRVEKAIELLERISPRDGVPDLVVSEALAQLYERKGRYHEALAVLHGAVRHRPEWGDGLLFLGDLSKAVGLIDEAAQAYAKAIDLDPSNAAAFYNLACCQQAVGAFDLALENYNQATVLDPEFIDAYFNIGNVYQQRQQHPFAAAAYRNALAVDPYDADAYYGLGVALHSADNRKDAIDNYRLALGADPNHAAAAAALNALGYDVLLQDILSLSRNFDVAAFAAHMDKVLPLLRQDAAGAANFIEELRRRSLLDHALFILDRLLENPGTLCLEQLLILAAEINYEVFHYRNHYDHEVRYLGHFDFLSTNDIKTPFLDYLKTPPLHALETAWALLEQALALPDRQSEYEERMLLIAVRVLARLGRHEEIVDLAANANFATFSNALREAAAFSLFALNRQREARLLLKALPSRSEDSRPRHLCHFAEAATMGEGSITLPPSLSADVAITATRTLIHKGACMSFETHMRFGGCSMHVIPQAIICDAHGTVMTENRIVRETMNCDPNWYFSEWPNISRLDSERALIACAQPTRTLEGPAFLAAYSRDQHSYAHWILDVLPRILVAQGMDVLKSLPVLITAPLTNWQLDMLRALGIDPACLSVVEGDLPLRCERLVVPIMSRELYFHPSAVLLLRKALDASGLLSPSPPWRRLYVRRRSSFRLLRNDEEVASALASLGFEEVYPERLTLAQQARLFSEAAIVVGSEGAALTNALFMRPGTALVGLGPATNNGPYYAVLSALLGLNYACVVGPSAPSPNITYIGWDFEVALSDLDKALDLVAPAMSSAKREQNVFERSV